MTGVIKYFPGWEPEEIRAQLDELFAKIDACFPDKVIVWYRWNHAEWDEAANYLSKTLGYSRGIFFLHSYGYTVDRTIPPEELKKRVKHHGRIVKILKYNKSGFIRCDDDGEDYYFNIRDFVKKTSLLEKGREADFWLTDRKDGKTGEVSLSAVRLEYTENIHGDGSCGRRGQAGGARNDE